MKRIHLAAPNHDPMTDSLLKAAKALDKIGDAVDGSKVPKFSKVTADLTAAQKMVNALKEPFLKTEGTKKAKWDALLNETKDEINKALSLSKELEQAEKKVEGDDILMDQRVEDCEIHIHNAKGNLGTYMPRILVGRNNW